MNHRKLLTDFAFWFLLMQGRCSLIYDLVGSQKHLPLSPSIWLVSKKSTRLYSSFDWPLVASVFLRFQSSRPPAKKLVCSFYFHWLWHRNVLPCRLGCSRYVLVWGIMLLVVLLLSCTQPLTPPRCQFKAVQSVSGGPDDAMMWGDRWGWARLAKCAS